MAVYQSQHNHCFVQHTFLLFHASAGYTFSALHFPFAVDSKRYCARSHFRHSHLCAQHLRERRNDLQISHCVYFVARTVLACIGLLPIDWNKEAAP